MTSWTFTPPRLFLRCFTGQRPCHSSGLHHFFPSPLGYHSERGLRYTMDLCTDMDRTVPFHRIGFFYASSFCLCRFMLASDLLPLLLASVSSPRSPPCLAHSPEAVCNFLTRSAVPLSQSGLLSSSTMRPSSLRDLSRVTQRTYAFFLAKPGRAESQLFRPYNRLPLRRSARPPFSFVQHAAPPPSRRCFLRRTLDHISLLFRDAPPPISGPS